MPVDTILYNTKICIHGNIVDAGIAIDNGKIVKIAKKTNLPSASRKMDLKGNITLPGLIDSHVHLRDQQLAYKETFITGTSAAAAGGVTLVIDMPNNKPVTMDSLSLKERIKLAENQSLINVAFNSAFPNKLEEMPEIIKVGAIGFKVYLLNKIGGIEIDDDVSLLVAFREAAKSGVPVAVHAEDWMLIENQKKQLQTLGQNNTEAYVAAHSPEAEAKSIKRVIQLAKKSGVHVHFCHISSELGLNAVLLAKKACLPVTCEVTPHNLLLSSKHYKNSGFFALTDPPIRTQNHTSALWNALKTGLVDIIASDHAPHTLDEKQTNSVWEAKPGVPGLETTLPLLLTQVNKGRLSLAELVKVTSEEPARIFNLPNRGCLAEQNWADLVVVDLKREYKIDSASFFSKAKYSPFDGLHAKGRPIKTFVNGQLVMNEGKIVTKSGIGQVVLNAFDSN
ncbi:MAG: dihydroorotase family protein [Candidatus Bathyarchaeota archaeon]|nr:dihydroorotase family protein [Candidatus Bathyarchaeum sp.]